MEVSMSDAPNTTSALAKAGARFPFINLEKALERAKQLFEADQRGREMAIAGAFAVWGYSEKSSGGYQTIGALKMYGLLKDSGGGDSRKLALTDEALRYFRDEREEERSKLAKRFALEPKILGALWSDWHASPPADTVARSHLKTEAKLNDQSARSLLAIYKENIAFAELKGDDKVPEQVGEPKRFEPSVEDDLRDLGFRPVPPLEARPDHKAGAPAGKVKIMEGERVTFTEEGGPGQYLKLVASGDVDDTLLEALESYVKRQRKRLEGLKKLLDTPASEVTRPEDTFYAGEAVPASGTYLHVHPSEHTTARKVLISGNQNFPTCDECGGQNYFKVVKQFGGN
jgi:hypothetical protein